MEKQYGHIIIYKTPDGNTKLEVKFYEDTVWLSQEQLVELYGSSKSNISEHIKHIFEEGELDENSTVRNFRTVASNGKTYNIKYYNLKMIIAIGYRVRSNIGTNFRKWATTTLEEYMIKGFAINDDLLKRAGGGRYFKELLARIRDIRSSERVFWRQVLDIFATSIDYDPKLEVSQEFFKTVQNKLHYAITGNTAAEIIYNRVDSEKEHMGLTNWKNSPDGLIYKYDVDIAKNYLNEDELKKLNRIVTMYLDYAEMQAENHNAMTMEDWIEKLNAFLQFNGKEILKNAGKISQKVAQELAYKEYERFKVKQDKMIVSDFDEFIKQTNLLEENKE